MRGLDLGEIWVVECISNYEEREVKDVEVFVFRRDGEKGDEKRC